MDAKEILTQSRKRETKTGLVHSKATKTKFQNQGSTFVAVVILL